MQVECGSAFVNVAQLVEYVVLAAALQSVTPEVAKKNRFAARQIERALERQSGGVRRCPSEAAGSHAGRRRPELHLSDPCPAYTVMFAFFLINIMASSFITERNLGTLRRLEASPNHPIQLLMGKTLPFFFVSLIQSVLLFLSGKVLFGMSWGVYPIMLLAVIFTTSMAATSLGLLLATFVRTESQVSAYANFSSLPWPESAVVTCLATGCRR